MTNDNLTIMKESMQLADTEPEVARRQLLELWDSLDPYDSAWRCIVAHYLADLYLDAEDSVRWDEVSLDEATDVSDEQLQKIHPTLSVAGFLPALHLNLADGYRRLGRFDDAIAHLEQSHDFDFALQGGSDEQAFYRSTITGGQSRVRELIERKDTRPLDDSLSEY